MESETLRLTVTVPPGTTAEVALTEGTRVDQAPGTATYESTLA